MHAFSVPEHTSRADYSVNNNNNQLIAAISRVSQKIRSRYKGMGKTNSYMCIAGKSVIKNCENNYSVSTWSIDYEIDCQYSQVS